MKVLHITESLNRGGAEVMLVSYVNMLPACVDNIVVYLGEPTTIKSELKNVSAVYCLDYHAKRDFLWAVIKLKKIISNYNVELVHSHLYWPTLIARAAISSKLPLIFSVHTLITYDAFKPNILSKYVEKLTYNKNQTAVFVSHAAFNDYKNHVTLTGSAKVIYNFVNDCFFSSASQKESFSDIGLKLVAVGNLRPQKGHLFLIQHLKDVAALNITLDIYGEGHQREDLENYLHAHQVTNVRLMGSEPHLERVLKKYDAFVFASTYEGFCIAMAEAMAVGLPCVLPNLEVLKEVSGGVQLYYEPGNGYDFINKILLLLQERRLLQSFSENARQQAATYTLAEHINQLTALYDSVLEEHGR